VEDIAHVVLMLTIDVVNFLCSICCSSLMVFSHISIWDFMVDGCYNIHWLISWGMKRITVSLNQLRVF